MKSVNINNKIISDTNPCFIIAEMAWSHDGSVEKAIKILDGASDAKADAICMHFTSVKDYMTEDYGLKHGVSVELNQETVYQYLERVNLKNEEWKKLVFHAKKQGLSVCIMCNDIPSIEFANSLDIDCYIIPPAAMVEENFVRNIGKRQKPVMVRIGGATLLEIEQTIKWINDEGNNNIVLIHGFQNFPTPLEEMHIKFIDTLKKRFSCPVGFADHVDAESEKALLIPLVSIGAGANLIEKHLTHNRGLKGEDFESALNPDEFRKLVQDIRECEKSLGSSEIRDLSEKEKKYRLMSRKRVVAVRDIKNGEHITKNLITFKRANEGIYPDEVSKIFGKKAKTNIKREEGITLDKVI